MNRSNQRPKKIVCIFGTRPEAIKMAPVVYELRRAQQVGNNLQTIVCVTGQHREMLEQVLSLFQIKPDYNMNVMKEDQDLFSLTSNIIKNMGNILWQIEPDVVLVHGDTTTAMAASISAFYLKAKVGHVEAGLRTNDRHQPFPEEINRRVADVLADYHFCPTETSKRNLLAEGVKEESIIVTGNTVIDALHFTLDRMKSDQVKLSVFERQFGYLKSITSNKKLILVTGHRRENFGNGFINICQALRDIVDADKNVEIVYPVHLNPNVWEPVHRFLANTKGIWLIDPLEYEPFLYLMDKASLILTDSGGIQEEAPSIGKPVLVMRDVTERPEAIEAGTARLVGTDHNRICQEVLNLLYDKESYARMSKAINFYGNGRVA